MAEHERVGSCARYYGLGLGFSGDRGGRERAFGGGTTREYGRRRETDAVIKAMQMGRSSCKAMQRKARQRCGGKGESKRKGRSRDRRRRGKLLRKGRAARLREVEPGAAFRVLRCGRGGGKWGLARRVEKTMGDGDVKEKEARARQL